MMLLILAKQVFRLKIRFPMEVKKTSRKICPRIEDDNKKPIFLQVFNRDEPDREKLVHVTVKASDNGRPQLEDVCTLKVRVKDRNDSKPIFDRGIYDDPVAQDTPIGTQNPTCFGN